MQRISIGQGITLAALLGLLIGTIILAISTWTSTSNVVISEQGWLAISLGTFFSLIVGCGLMALVFYSSRHGYDEAVDEFRDSRSREQAKWMAERENKSLDSRREP